MSWSEQTVFQKLSKVFPPPAYIWLPQVRNGVGYARRTTRTADAIGVSVYPSRGVYMMGVEIKVSKSDWRKELGDGDKAEDIGKYCKYWYVAAPKDLIPIGEVPDKWGLIEVTDSTCSVTKAAKSNECQPPDMLLLASILRSTAKSVAGSIPKSELDDLLRSERERAVVGYVHSSEIKYLKDSVAAFEKATGLKLPKYDFQSKSLGRDVALVQKLNVQQLINHTTKLCDVLKQQLPSIEEAIQEFNSGQN